MTETPHGGQSVNRIDLPPMPLPPGLPADDFPCCSHREKPDLSIPEAALKAAEEAMRGHDCHPVVNANIPHLARAALAAALPHLRSLQVETQVRIGRELGRAEAWEEIADAVSLGEDWQVEDPRISYVDVQVDKDMYLKLEEIRANRASRAAEPGSDGLTASPGTSGHPQDSQTAREAL